MGQGKRVGVYCSDVSGAFDKVSVSLLVDKCARYGVRPQLLKVF